MKIKFVDLSRQYNEDRRLILDKVDEISKKGEFILAKN